MFMGRLSTLLVGTMFLIGANTAVVKEDKNFWHSEGLKDIRASLEKERIEGQAKNVILFVGDGMGVITHTLARIYKGQKEGKTGEEGKLFWENFPYSGLIKTYNTDYQVADSAGTATALLTGVKTSLGVVGVDSSIEKSSVCDGDKLKRGTVDSIKDWAHMSKKDVGVVTTTRLTHATPASLYAHSPNRNWEADTDQPANSQECPDIARQLVSSLEAGQLAFALGGGKTKFRSKANGGSRNDEDLVNYLRSKGIEVVFNTGELRKWNYKTQMLGLFSDSHTSYETQRNKNSDGSPSLTEMTRQALNRLRMSENGYFLLVEGGRIDHAHHENKAKLALEETLELDRAVQAALEMVDPKDTLIMVTADHSHAVTLSGYPKRGNPVLGTVYDLEHPEEWSYMWTKENQSQPYQSISYANGPGFLNHFDPVTRDWRNISQMDVNDDEYQQPATFFLPYETHGGEDVVVYARGPQAHHVTGLHEQSFLGVLMGYAGCFNRPRFGCPPAIATSPANRIGGVGLEVLVLLLAVLGMKAF